MKRFLALLLLLLLLPCACLAQGESPQVSEMSAEELLALRNEVNARLRALGAYPFQALKKGAKGEGVTALQTRLTELSFYEKEINGSYDTNTVNAMKAFEKANGFKQDGAASVDDQIALFAPAALPKPTPTPTKTPKPTATPNRSKAYPKMDFGAVGMNPDAYASQKMSLTGTVVQVILDADGCRLRIATDGDNGNIVYVTAAALNFEPKKGDQLACFGTYQGLFTYQTAQGQPVTLPALEAEIVEKIG